MADKLNDDIQSLKKQKRLLINQINKTQVDYEAKQKEEELKMKAILEEKYKKMEEEMKNEYDAKLNDLKEKLAKEEKKSNRRNLREKKKIMKIVKPKTVSRMTQTPSVATVEIALQTDVEEKTTTQEMSTQCDMMVRTRDTLDIVEEITESVTSELDTEFYVIQYIKAIDTRKNRPTLSKAYYLSSNTETLHYPSSVCIFNSTPNTVTISGTFRSDLYFAFFTGKQGFVRILYTHARKKSNTLAIMNDSGSGKSVVCNTKIDKNTLEDYKVTMSIRNGTIEIYFDNVLQGSFESDQTPTFFISSSNTTISCN